jgi:acyl-CoA reductase-like NAD-dependent aldehyde dehydrogenase
MTATLTTDFDTLFIGGAMRPAHSAERITAINASTEEAIGSVPHADEQDVDAAVAAARAAFDDPAGWSSWEPARRAEALLRLADEIEARSEQTVQAVSSQNGMPRMVAGLSEAVAPAMLLRYYAGLAPTIAVEEERPSLAGGTTRVTRRPIGVVAAIVPWNYPQTLTFFKLAPALAAGCTIVLKPAPETVLDAYVLADAIAAADLPPGVVNIVPAGREVGQYLVEHRGIDKVAFTGSTAAGRGIAETCGRLLRPVTLELGGKSAAIVLDDADLVSNIENLFVATMLNNGQTCYLGTRVLAPRSRYEEVVQTVAGLASSLAVGDPMAETTQIGPMASARQRDRVESYIAKGKGEGARLVVGGGRPASQDRGWYVEPTVFADVDNNSTIAQEEIFGPVLSVIGYGDVDDAVAIANDSDYGLGGSVWTQDTERGIEVARRVQTGSIGVNGYMPDFASPFGGVKASGIGRELGPEGLASYQTLKSIYLF